jgi:hypothetical protein
LLHSKCSQISVIARFGLAEELLPVAAQADESFYPSQQAEIKYFKIYYQCNYSKIPVDCSCT